MYIMVRGVKATIMEKIKSTDKIYDVINKYPDVTDIMVELGFSDIIKPGMLQSAGRIMTIEKGSKMKNIPWDEIIDTFEKQGYLVVKEKQK